MIRARVIKIEEKSHVRIKPKKKKKARARINFFRRGIQRTTWEAKSIVHFCLPWISADANPRWRAFVRKQFTRQWTPGSTRFTVRVGAKKGDPYTTDSLLSLPRENYYVYQERGQDLEKELAVFGWGLLARRLDALPRGLPPARALVTAVVRRAAWLRAGGGSLAPPPTAGPRRGRPIGGGWPRCAGTVPAPALRHAAQLLLHRAHGPLLPGAPICSSSSRPLLVAHVVVAAVVAVPPVAAVNPLLLRFPRITATSFPSQSRSVNPGPEAERDGVSPRASSLLPSASPARSPRPINGRRSVKVLSSARTATDWIESRIDALFLSLSFSSSFDPFPLFSPRA